MAEIIVLTPEQEKLVLDAFNNSAKVPSITDLIRLAFPDSPPEVDGRSVWGRSIKALLALKGVQAKTKTNYEPIEKIALDESKKEFIRNNYQAMSVVEMARTLFQNEDITNLNQETRCVAEFLKTLQPIPSKEVNDVPVESYRPPKSVPGVLLKVDKYVFGHGINKDAITAQQKAGLEGLLSYLNTFRFGNQINLYETQTARDLFESSFVRYTYDKPDLTEEEVDQYINVSHDNVSMAATQVRIERLSSMMDQVGNNADERARLSMTLVEAINNLNTEYNQIAKRQQSLLGDLKQKRADRIADLRSANASILNLVQLWKEEGSRTRLLHLADARKELLKRTMGEFTGMEEIRCRLLGINPDEIVNS